MWLDAYLMRDFMMLKQMPFANRAGRTLRGSRWSLGCQTRAAMSASDHNSEGRSGWNEPAMAARSTNPQAFEAGWTRGTSDGAEWARHRAATADLRGMCDRPDHQLIASEELLRLLEKYPQEPSVPQEAGQDIEPYREGYSVGFQRGACAVWYRLRELAAELDRLF